MQAEPIPPAPVEGAVAATGSESSSVLLVITLGFVAVPGLLLMTLLATVLTRR
jgi:hypothetical protein